PLILAGGHHGLAGYLLADALHDGAGDFFPHLAGNPDADGLHGHRTRLAGALFAAVLVMMEELPDLVTGARIARDLTAFPVAAINAAADGRRDRFAGPV